MPADAWEHRLLPILVRWRCEIVEQTHPTEEDKDFMDATLSAFERMQARARDEGLSQGLSQGLLLLAHQFERRLGRSLSAAERATLTERLPLVGPVRLGDVVLDLDPAALAAWLADPNAR